MLNIVYFGTPDFSAYLLEQLIKFHPGGGTSIKFNIKAVVTSPAPSPVALVTQKHGIPVLKPFDLNNGFIYSELLTINPELFIVFSYGKILPKSLLDIPKYGSINIHPSLLPKYRGASPIQSVILAGSKTTGVTIMLMDEGMDHGPILSTKEVRLSEQDTFESLSKKITLEAFPLLLNTMEDFIAGKIKPRVQNHAIATFCPLIKKRDGYFDIDHPPSKEKLDRMVRAYYPWPGVWTKWSPSAKASGDKKEKIIKFLPHGLVQMEGKKPTTLQNFLNGYPDFPIKEI